MGGSLYRRFYLYTLLLCFLTLLISFAAITLGRRSEWREMMHQFSRTVSTVASEHLIPHLADGTAPASLADLAERFQANVTLLDPEGKRLAVEGTELTAPTGDELSLASHQGFGLPHRPRFWGLGPLEALGSGRSGERRDRWLLIPLRRGDQVFGYLQFAPAHVAETRAALRLAATLAVILAVVALLMVPAISSVTRPLVRLTDSARRFAGGDFAHRVPLEGPREVARLGAEMNEMAERISTLLHTQRQLLADVSHELRSPLARIEIALELARAGGVAEKPLQSIGGDVAELEQLIQDILTNSRLELRPDLVKRERVPAAELLRAAQTRALAGGVPGAQLELQDDGGDAVVDADPTLVSHALTNLLDNARRHTPEGTRIVLGSRREGGRLLLFVRDRGPGIASEELPRLFEPFYRPDAARARSSGGGSGLGLSLVRRIAELHGAAPFVRSTPEEGSTFGLTLEIV